MGEESSLGLSSGDETEHLIGVGESTEIKGGESPIPITRSEMRRHRHLASIADFAGKRAVRSEVFLRFLPAVVSSKEERDDVEIADDKEVHRGGDVTDEEKERREHDFAH